MITAALTGGIGSGKSTVARIFRVLGVPVFEADREARALQDGDEDLKKAIAERFGADLYASGTLDRRALAQRVFGNDQALAELNAMVHPAVRAAFHRWAAAQHAPYVILESALVVGSGRESAFDRTIVVSAPEAVRIQRVMERDGVGAEAVKARLRHQASDEELHAVADHVILNDGSSLVIPQVLKTHDTLLTLST
jgi:dephospho-CoA kinase